MGWLLTVLFSSICLLGNHLQAEEHNDEPDQPSITQYLETSTDPLFVSLGSTCGPATAMRSAGVRKGAFPLDWLFSFDGEKIIEMLDTDFLHFTNQAYLTRHANRGLLNTYYHLEFPHDGTWTGANFSRNVPPFQKKYQRRIDRFRRLRQYHGKIYFVRCAWYLSTQPSYAFSSPENLQISEDYAKRLYNALKRYFPNVDVYLVIKNPSQRGQPGSTKILGKILILKIQDYDFNYILQTFSQGSLESA
jgi:hypothetical protein